MAEAAENARLNGKMEDSTATSAIAMEDQIQVEGSSDGEGEKTARERLKKTSIAGLVQKSADNDSPNDAHPLSQSMTMDTDQADTTNGTRGRPAKKRSFEDLARSEMTVGEEPELAEQPLPKSGHHKRMRSRDVASGEHVAGKYESDVADPVHEEDGIEAERSLGGPGILVDAPVKEADDVLASDKADTSLSAPTSNESEESANAIVEPDSRAGKDVSSTQLKPGSAFSNTSSASPFGALSAKSPSPATIDNATDSSTKSTSSSAFASSGLSAFASSEKSPFGATANKGSSGFGSGPSSTNTFGSSTSGGFGSSTTAAPFGSKPSSGFGSGSGFGSSSGFGSAGGFGAAKPFGSGTSSFAAPSGTSGTFGSGKPFTTATKDEDEDGTDVDKDDDDEQKRDVDAQQDSRFHEQDVETGEEGEQTIFTARAKLYHFEKEWKERGVGTFKINIRYAETQLSTSTSTSKLKGSESTDADDNKGEVKESSTTNQDIEAGENEEGFTTTERKARLLMRTDGVHRVILNTPVFKGMHIGQQDGTEPTGKTMHLTGLEDGKPRAFQVKIGKEEVLRDLYWKVIDLRSDFE